MSVMASLKRMRYARKTHRTLLACRAIRYERKPKGNAVPVIEPNGVALPTIGREDQERCEELLQRWMVALNSYDAAGMKSVMRFPHVRLAENRVAVYQDDDNPMDLFARLRQQHGWHHSAWNEIKLVQSSPTKAHYAVQYTRYHEDGSVLSVCDSLYIFTCVDGDWKLQGRSSFGA